MKKYVLMFLGLILFTSLASASEPAKTQSESVILGAGCFWCIQPPYDKLKDKGVISTTVGYSGGETENPTYQEVSAGNTGHLEVIQVVFNPQKISLEKVLDVFWKNIDPFDGDGQFCDKGSQYLSAIFATTAQMKIAEQSLAAIQKNKKEKVVTKILPAKKFYAAEEYHQSYYSKNPIRYKYYRYSCGRDKRLKEIGL